MEENNNSQNQYTQNNTNFNRYWKECLAMIIAAFLGGFLAMYFVADQVFDKHHSQGYFSPDSFERRMINDFNKMYEREKKAFDHDFGFFEPDWYNNAEKKFNAELNKNKKQNALNFSGGLFGENKRENKIPKAVLNPFIIPDMTMDSVKIKTELENDKYKVIIGLNAFQGDESKINYNVAGRKLTVFGSSKVKEKKYEQDMSFSQDFLLPYNADIANISKKKDGNKLVIEVPLKD